MPIRELWDAYREAGTFVHLVKTGQMTLEECRKEIPLTETEVGILVSNGWFTQEAVEDHKQKRAFVLELVEKGLAAADFKGSIP